MDQKNWKILKEMGIPDHLTCLLRSLYAGQEATFSIEHKTQMASEKEREYVKAVCHHSAYLTYMQNTSWKTLVGRSTSCNQDCQEKYQ